MSTISKQLSHRNNTSPLQPTLENAVMPYSRPRLLLNVAVPVKFKTYSAPSASTNTLLSTASEALLPVEQPSAVHSPPALDTTGDDCQSNKDTVEVTGSQLLYVNTTNGTEKKKRSAAWTDEEILKLLDAYEQCQTSTENIDAVTRRWRILSTQYTNGSYRTTNHANQLERIMTRKPAASKVINDIVKNSVGKKRSASVASLDKEDHLSTLVNVSVNEIDQQNLNSAIDEYNIDSCDDPVLMVQCMRLQLTQHFNTLRQEMTLQNDNMHSNLQQFIRLLTAATTRE